MISPTLTASQLATVQTKLCVALGLTAEVFSIQTSISTVQRGAHKNLWEKLNPDYNVVIMPCPPAIIVGTEEPVGARHALMLRKRDASTGTLLASQQCFAALSADLPPGLASAGNMAFGHENAGLRGGSFHFAANQSGYRFALSGLQWTQDVAVFGVVDWDQVHGTVDANIDAVQQSGISGKLHIRWDTLAAGAVAELDGSLGGRAVVAHSIAP